MTESMLGEIYRNATRPESRSACPASGVLVACAEGVADDVKMADHLADCSACSEEYRVLRDVAPARRVVQRRVSTAWPLAAAAMLVLSIALGAVAFVLLERNRDLRADAPSVAPIPAIPTADVADRREDFEPRPNVAIIDLLPASAVTRGGETPQAAVPAGAEQFTLVLNVETDATYDDYALEISDSRGRIVWSGRGLARSPNDTFTLHASRQFLPEDVYRLRLYGTRGESKTLIEAYAVDLIRR